MNKDILKYVSHKYPCIRIQSENECTCGLYDRLDEMLSSGLSKHVRSTTSLVTLYTLYETVPEIITDWERTRFQSSFQLPNNQRELPEQLHLCGVCGYSTAKKNGCCYICGEIPIGLIGPLIFSKDDGSGVQTTEWK